MKALFSRLTGGNGKSRDKLVPDSSSDTRSLKDKPQPALPPQASSSSLANTPSISERELPPIATTTENLDDDHSILGVPASMLSTQDLPATASHAPSPALTKRPSSTVDHNSLRPPHEPSRRASQQHLPQSPPPLNRISSRTPKSNSLSSSANTGAGTSKSGGGDGPAEGTATTKKVAFISPPPTTTSLVSPSADGPPTPSAQSTSAANGGNLSRTKSPTQPPSGAGLMSAASGSGRHVSDPPMRIGGYTPGAQGGNALRASNAASASNAYLNDATSMRSGTPLSYMSGRTGIQAAASWSEAAEGDLVSNLGSRERTRQEVLWEIVASEDRYVVELLKFKETFIDPLLHPYSSAPVASPALSDPLPDYNSNTAYFRSETPMTHRSTATSHPRESLENLPIASRFLSSPVPIEDGAPPPNSPRQPTRKRSNLTSRRPGASTPVIPDEDEGADSYENTDDEDALGRGYASGTNRVPVRGSPYNANSGRSRNGLAAQLGKNLPFPTGGARSHSSLPPPPRQSGHPPRVSTTSLVGNIVGTPHTAQNSSRPPTSGRNSTSTTNRLTKRVFGAGRKDSGDSVTMPQTLGGGGSASNGNGPNLAPHLLPEDLRKCLEVLETNILNGHVALSDGLRKRYEEQYPLVRSLADVFIANSHILKGYATYVLHLEKALEQVDDALSTVALAKKPKKQDVADWMHVSRVLRELEDNAADKGETGLAISLSKPFQRLLKYPLLFQNLLFHTDPSTFEYENTLEMVAEVEKIVRSIEDEKIQQEERDKTRDVIARIDGLEKVKALAAPKASRQLVLEKPLFASTSGTSTPPNGKTGSSLAPPPDKKVAPKSSFRRFSDALQPGGTSANPTVGGKKDLWLVTFNDVVLRCQRIGTTTMPLASSTPTTGARSASMSELQGKAKNGTNGRRTVQTKPRNLYKFLKIETWTIGDLVQPGSGVVAMEDISKARTKIGEEQKKKPDDEEDLGNASDDSDRKSKMSFSYWGADKITLQTPAAKARSRQAAKNAIAARRGPAPSAYSTANAKFGTRLRSPEPGDSPNRPASRRTGPAANNAPSIRKTSVETSKPPAWNSMGARGAQNSSIPKRVQKLSAPTPVKPEIEKMRPTASPAPSELTQDSGVGLYRDVLSQDPTLNRTSS